MFTCEHFKAASKPKNLKLHEELQIAIPYEWDDPATQ